MQRTNGRVAYLSLETPVAGQASHTHVHEIINGLRGNSWTVELFATSGGGASAGTGFARRIVEQLSVQRRLAARLGEFDAIFLRGHFMAWPISCYARIRGTPTVHEINGRPDDVLVTYPALAPLRQMLSALYRSQFRSASQLITVTEGLGAWAETFAGHGRVTVIPNGANTELFCPEGPSQDALGRYVVFVGGLVAWHGIRTMLRAIDTEQWPKDVRLVVVGDGIERSRLEAASGNPRLLWLGRRPYDEVPALLRGAIASLCTIEDPHGRSATGVAPLKLFEAMACGSAVIVTELPYQAELVRTVRAGVVIAPEDPEALARAVANMADDLEATRTFGARGAAYVRAHASWQARAEETGRVILKAMRHD